jgi:GT2 family glycosyltransferase
MGDEGAPTSSQPVHSARLGPEIVAVVLNWNGGEDTIACLASLAEAEVETICVDNGSGDGSADAVAARFPAVELLRNEGNLGYSAGNNVGIRRALERGAAWVWLVNNDATVARDAPAALAAAAEARPEAGVLACKVYFAYPPDLLWYAGGRVSTVLGYSGRQDGYGKRDSGGYDRLRNVDRASGAAMAVSRLAVERAGLLDEDLFAYVEDVDWCLRIRAAGFAVVFVPGARVWHRVSAATGGGRSTTSLYYDTRNTLAVVERHRPLPRGARGLRRGIVVGSHLVQAMGRPNRREAAAAVLEGWTDFRRGRLGQRRR